MKKLLFVMVTIALLCCIPAVAAAADVHTVIAQRPYVLIDGQTGAQYSQNQLSGYATIDWKDKTRYGFFNAKVTVTSVLPAPTYEFQLISISNCNDDFIEGLFDIYKNNLLVASGIVGRLSLVDQPVGMYFKFYGGDTQNNTNIWHLSAFITNRFDF